MKGLVRTRLASKEDLQLLVGVCIFPTHLWAMVIFLFNMPGIILHMSVGEVVGIYAYSQLVILTESVMLFLFVFSLLLLSPRRWFQGRYVAQGTVIVTVCSLWAAALVTKVDVGLAEISLLGFLILLFSVLVARLDGFSHVLSRIAGFLNSPSMTFLAIDGACLLVVFARTIS